MSAPPSPGSIVYGVDPLDPLKKPGRPAIVLRVEEAADALLTVIFGQSFNTGLGPAMELSRGDPRLEVHGYFYLSSVRRLPLSHFAEVHHGRLPRDKWRELVRLFTTLEGESGP